MNRIVVPALMLAGVMAAAQTAQGQPRSGCWHYTDGSSVFSSVCLNGTSTGTFNIEYAIEDPDQGLVKGSCNGVVEVTTLTEASIAFTVPYQENACRQEDQVFRMAQRDYDCVWSGLHMVCEQTVYYDDGTVFSRTSGVEYNR